MESFDCTESHEKFLRFFDRARTMLVFEVVVDFRITGTRFLPFAFRTTDRHAMDGFIRHLT